jgi:hypothetical protein
MELFGYLFGILCAVAVILVAAMPDQWFQAKGSKQKAGGPDYWTDYPRAGESQSQSGKHIVVAVRPRKYKTLENDVSEAAYANARNVSVEARN